MFVQRVGALVERAGASVVAVVVAKVVVLEAAMVLVAVSRAGAVVVAAKMQCNAMQCDDRDGGDENARTHITS